MASKLFLSYHKWDTCVHVSLDHLHPLPDPNENVSKSNTIGTLIKAEQLYAQSQDDLMVSVHLLDLESAKCQWS